MTAVFNEKILFYMDDGNITRYNDLHELPRYRLPRLIEAEHPGCGLAAWLRVRSRTLRPRGELEVPVVGLTDAFADALRASRRSGSIIRGIEGAADALARENRGLELLKQRMPQGERISRLLLFSRDGTDNFYRKVESLLVKYSPRVLGCVIDCDSLCLGGLLFGPGMTAKLVLVSHKQDVARILLSLIAEAPSAAGQGVPPS